MKNSAMCHYLVTSMDSGIHAPSHIFPSFVYAASTAPIYYLFQQYTTKLKDEDIFGMMEVRHLSRPNEQHFFCSNRLKIHTHAEVSNNTKESQFCRCRDPQ